MQNILISICEKFYYDRLRNDRALGNRKSDNNKSPNNDNKNNVRTAIGDPGPKSDLNSQHVPLGDGNLQSSSTPLSSFAGGRGGGRVGPPRSKHVQDKSTKVEIRRARRLGKLCFDLGYLLKSNPSLANV